MWIFLLIAVIIAVIIYPYIAVAIYRYKAIAQLRVKLRQIGGRMRVLRTIAFISANRSSKYDLLVEKNEKLYAVKLWSCAHKNSDLRIYSDGRVGEERTHKAPMIPKERVGDRSKTARYSARQVNKTLYNFKTPNSKKIINVLLVYPSYRNVILERNGEEKMLQSGDVFFDKIMLTPYAFLKMLSGTDENKNK